MNKLLLTKVLPTIISIAVLTFFTAPATFAKKGGNGGGSGGGKPPPEPTVCTDEFPGFSYMVEPTRKSPGEIRLASIDGCRTEWVHTESADGRGGGPLHMTADRSKGVLLWQEEPGNAAQYVVWRQDFTVDGANGKLILEDPVQLLPRPGEEVPDGDELYFFNQDIWGDATHDSLYLAVTRMHGVNTGSGEVIRELFVYNLNEMTDVREIYLTAQLAGEWNCPDVTHPQFVPTCYEIDGIRFNPSGTRLYIKDNFDDKQGQRWDGVVRLDIDRIDLDTGADLPLAAWAFSDPELVYTGEDGTGGMLARPDSDPSLPTFPEYIVISAFNSIGSILDADQCANEYSGYASGEQLLPSDFWHSCIVADTFFSPNGHGGGDSWQTPDTILQSRLRSRGRGIYDIYRYDTTDGTEQLLIENARGADSGL